MLGGSLCAQSTRQPTPKYKTRIILNEGELNPDMSIYTLTDSAVFMVNRPVVGSRTVNPDWMETGKVMIQNIETIKVRKKGSIGQGFLLGAAVGVYAAFAACLYCNDMGEFRSWASDLPYFIPVVITFSLAGGAIGTKYTHYPIKQDHARYELLRPELERYAIVGGVDHIRPH
jgi:hypothetical protein